MRKTPSRKYRHIDSTHKSDCYGTQTDAIILSASCSENGDCNSTQKINWVLYLSGSFTLLGLALFLICPNTNIRWLDSMSTTVAEMAKAMWWGIVSAGFFVGLLNRIPQSVVMGILGDGKSNSGLFRATFAGVFLDLCNHGILMIAMQLYKKGASMGQVVAFLVASPWNSFTLTFILMSLIGLPLTLAFIALSAVVAIISGIVFNGLTKMGYLPENPNQTAPTPNKGSVWAELKQALARQDWSVKGVLTLFWEGLKESKSVLKWVFLGIALIAIIRAFVNPESFGAWFGATVSGLFLTLLFTTLLEVCSEGSSPIAADLVNRASAPGNAFTFLMAGASTDYTEIMSVKDTTKSWKMALCIPLVTVPQILVIGYLLN